MYLTYDDYADMGGTLDEAAFELIEFDAESIVNWHTFNRLQKETTYPHQLKKLMFKLIQLAQMRQTAYSLGESNGGVTVGGAITQQSNDGFSTTYNALSASEALSAGDKETRKLIQFYLLGVTDSLGHALLYRGVYPNE